MNLKCVFSDPQLERQNQHTGNKERNPWRLASAPAGLIRLKWLWEFRTLSPLWQCNPSFRAQFKCHLHWKVHSDAPKLSSSVPPVLLPRSVKPLLAPSSHVSVISYVSFPSLECEFPGKQSCILFLFYPQHLAQFPGHRRSSVNVEPMNEGIKE